MPILKQSGSAHTKKRSRIDRQMISAPLGDFRHTMHVGRGGDVFGDTSFLSKHGPSQPADAPDSPKENGASRAAAEEQDFQERKVTADSLSQSSGIESGSGSWTSSPANSGSPREDHPQAWNMASSRAEEDQLDWLSPSNESGMKHAESILSFHLDLGPSIMDEVLGVMDKEAPAGDWRSMEDQYDFGYKFSPEKVSAEKVRPRSPSPCAVVETPVMQYSPAPTPSNERVSAVRDSTSSSASGTLEENHSSYDGDSEEEKRSVYEGIPNGPGQPGRSVTAGRNAGQEDEEEEEEVGQGYTFDDDDDSDDEIGV